MCKGCGSGRASQSRGLPVPQAPALGDVDLVRVTCTIENVMPQYGAVTATRYPFDVQPTLWVDARDAEVLLARGGFSRADR